MNLVAYLREFTARRSSRSRRASAVGLSFAESRWSLCDGWSTWRRAGVQRIVLNGSFVTDIMEPNDVDCVLLAGTGFPQDQSAADEFDAGLPFLEIAIVPVRAFNTLVDRFFATNRFGVPKGVVELMQWN